MCGCLIRLEKELESWSRIEASDHASLAINVLRMAISATITLDERVAFYEKTHPLIPECEAKAGP